MAVNVIIPSEVSQTINDGTTNKAPSENAVFDALANKASGTGTANGTNTGDETQSTIKTKLGSASSGVDGYLLGTDWTTFNGKQNALGFTPEDVSNKQTDLTASATKYPTVNAVNTGLAQNKNTLTMLAQGNNDFTILASIIARPTGTPVNGQPIVWQVLTNSDNHDSSFVRGVAGQSSGALRFLYPQVKNVVSFVTAPDEAYVTEEVQTGCTVGTTYADLSATRTTTAGFQLKGNGTNWTASGRMSSYYSLASFSSGRTALNMPSTYKMIDAETVQITYTGTNNYRIRRVYSGIPGTMGLAFFLVDNATNLDVTSAPTTNDYVHISCVGNYREVISLNTWQISNTQVGNGFMLPAYNFWTLGVFELWFKVDTLSTTSLRARWQAKTGVTQYKLNRSTAYTVDVNGNFVLTAPTQVYAGTDLSFTDTGLTTNTMYYYQLTDQSNVEISQFNQKTY